MQIGNAVIFYNVAYNKSKTRFKIKLKAVRVSFQPSCMNYGYMPFLALRSDGFNNFSAFYHFVHNDNSVGHIVVNKAENRGLALILGSVPVQVGAGGVDKKPPGSFLKKHTEMFNIIMAHIVFYS